MKKDVYSLDELAQKTGATPDDIAEWTRIKILKPFGFSDDKLPLFTAENLEKIAHIRKLRELGYGAEAIQKIIRKVGLPIDGRGPDPSPEKDRYLTVGALAERSGVSPRTIKHWEDKGILEPDMRTEGGFRLYPESYIFLCQLIRDLQLFGYTLEEIKALSDDVRTFLVIEADPASFPPSEVEAKLAGMIEAIQALFDRMKLLREGIDRWEDLLKKKRKDILALQAKNRKRADPLKEAGHV
ncbi:MAG: MerR family transcriptional regulator [Acidobacteriota bacterium]|nr:MerR family transcriptional regulator [Acidobacteriota bacterium]